MADIQSRKIIKEINPLFFIGIGALAVLYIIDNNAGFLTNTKNAVYSIGSLLMVLFAFLNRERRLLTLEEAQAVAYSDAKKIKNSGLLGETGRLILLEDGKLREINNKIDKWVVGVGIEGPEPRILVYDIEPYTGIITEREKVNFWNTRKDPNLKIMIPQQWWDYLPKIKEVVLGAGES